MEFQEYPKAMHGPKGAYAIVKNAQEEKALGAGWIDGHQHWAAKSAPKKESPKESPKA